MKLKLLTLGLMAGAAMTVSAQHVMNVDTKAMGAAIQPTMYGLFFEDINFAADDGLSTVVHGLAGVRQRRTGG